MGDEDLHRWPACPGVVWHLSARGWVLAAADLVPQPPPSQPYATRPPVEFTAMAARSYGRRLQVGLNVIAGAVDPRRMPPHVAAYVRDAAGCICVADVTRPNGWLRAGNGAFVHSCCEHDALFKDRAWAEYASAAGGVPMREAIEHLLAR